eukprot:2000973-Alexandrium_andersonii.AAC.1
MHVCVVYPLALAIGSLPDFQSTHCGLRHAGESGERFQALLGRSLNLRGLSRHQRWGLLLGSFSSA